jgi:uncharacterized protein (TIGR03435 family)
MTAEHLSSTLANFGPAFANHIWQSTVFLGIVALLTISLRKHQARLRFSLWLAASIKFLVPFSLLATLGGLLPMPQHVARGSQPGIYAVIDVAGQPFSVDSARPISSVAHAGDLYRHLAAQFPLLLSGIWLLGAFVVLLVWLSRWRKVSATLHRASPVQHGREIRLLRRLEEMTDRHGQISLRLSPELMEPGIFGIVEPVLIWPEQLSERLDDEQMWAILAHEMTHQRRHDNLTAAIHMLVEILFWFHPMVWWMERRMMEERERACDEAVVRLGGSQVAYAEGLLKACRFCVEAPLACVSGITGADLSRRVRAIMMPRLSHQLGLKGKVLLAVAAVMVIVGPVTFGAARAAQQPSGQESPTKMTGTDTSLPVYDVSVIRRAASENEDSRFNIRLNTLDVQNIALNDLLQNAFDVPKDMIVGLPEWAKHSRLDINAKTLDPDIARLRQLTIAQRRAMMRRLLEDRMGLKWHYETRVLPSYDLLVGNGGSKLKPTVAKGHNGGYSVNDTRFRLTNIPVSDLAVVLSDKVGRPVVDKTGLAGRYDISLAWSPDLAVQSTAPDAPPPLFTAVQEQLGLKLKGGKDAVQVFVIDRLTPPVAN